MSTKQKEASKATSKKIKKLKDEKQFKEKIEALTPVFAKKEGMKKELAVNQLEDAILNTEGLSAKSVKKVADAAEDDKQLTKSLEKLERNFDLPREFKGGGRAMYKSGMRVCKLAKRGKGRAYGKNS